MRRTFLGLHARTFSHATEDLEKVKLAVANTLGDVEQVVSRTEGHHGNPIFIVEAHVEDPVTMDDFFDRLGDEGMKRVLDSLDRRIDEGCNLFLKIDKQAAYEGMVQMAHNDDVISVRIRVGAFPARCDIAQGIVSEYLRARLASR